MKKSFLILICFLCIYSLSGQRLSLAVTQVEPIGVDRDTARLVEEHLQTELSKIPIFQLVEGERLDALLEEQELQLSGITSTASAAQAGNIRHSLMLSWLYLESPKPLTGLTRFPSYYLN